MWNAGKTGAKRCCAMRECSPRSGVTERRAATTVLQMAGPGRNRSRRCKRRRDHRCRGGRWRGAGGRAVGLRRTHLAWHLRRGFGLATTRPSSRKRCCHPPLLDLDRRQKKPYTKLCSQLAQTHRRAPPPETCKYPDGGDAYQPVLFQFVPGAFHLDVLPGRKSCAGPKTC